MNRRHDICRTASDCRKSLFFQKKCLFSIPIPFRTLCWLCFVQSLVCPYFGILAENPFPCERLCMLGWLCIVQSLWAYTPGVRAGAECGAAALTPLGATPKARTLWLLAKSFARCKTNKASNVRHPIFI